MKSFQQIVLDEYFEPTIGKAIRVMLALVLPLIWGMATHHVGPAVWIAVSAQVLSSVNIRGAYPLKLLILSGAVLACAVCAAVGTLAGNEWISAALLMAALAFLGGFVRQSGTHGPGITVAVLLLYLLCLDHPGDLHAAGEMFIWVLEGGILALISTLAAWAFVPFSPFRRSIALTWKMLAEWLQAFSQQTGDGSSDTPPVSSLDEKELALRNELNDSMETLSRKQAIAHARQNRYSYHLAELRKIASEAGNTLSSLRAIADPALQSSRFPDKLYHYVLDNMRLVAQRIAISIVTHRPEDVYTVRLSMERVRHHLSLLHKSLPDESPPGAALPVKQILDDLAGYFDQALSILEKASGRPGKMTFFLRNFLTGMTIPQQIPWVRFEFSSRSFTFRFSLRLALAMGIGIAFYKFFTIPHGYWIAMTAMIVLQPEFGATMTKAFNRTKGTVLGAVVGSLIFLVHLPLAVNILIVVICTFFMTYFILRSYAVAAFFITVMVIALFHLLEPVTWQLGGIRVMNTLAGCGLALLGGYAFWPLWERFRFPALIGRAVHANKLYLNMIMNGLKSGKKMTFDDFIRFRREAEMTNNNTFLCLRRMENEPEHEQQNLSQFFVITGHNIRITRLINALNQQLRDRTSAEPFPVADAYNTCLGDILAQIEIMFDDRHKPGKHAFVPLQETTREIKALLSASTLTKAPDSGMIRNLLERIALEATGMYYAAYHLAYGSEDFNRR